ncbi:hypothetical protein ACJX0J_012810, partial [Zea mays]
REKDPEKKYPHRAILYIHTHKANTTKNTNPHVVQFSSNLYWFKIFIDVWTIFQRINFRRLQNLLVIFHQRVYVEPQNQEFRMHNEKTYSLREQEAKEYEDLQPTSRNTSTIHKVLCYLITHLSRFHGIMQTLIICIELKKIKVADTRQGKLQRTDRLATTHKVKRKDMQSATTFDKTKCATTSK